MMLTVHLLDSADSAQREVELVDSSDGLLKRDLAKMSASGEVEIANSFDGVLQRGLEKMSITEVVIFSFSVNLLCKDLEQATSEGIEVGNLSLE